MTVNIGATLSNYTVLGTLQSTTVNGVLTNQGTLQRQGGDYVSTTDSAEGTVVYAGTTGTVQSYGGTSDYYNLSFSSAYTYSLASSLTANGTISIGASATLSIGANTLFVAGSWSNSGTAAVGGTVQFINSAITSTIIGTTTFTNLVSTTAGKAIHFTSGTTQTVTLFTITGTAASPVSLAGSTSATWTITSTTSNVAYASVTYSTATNPITSYTSTNGGNNTGWNFSTVYTWYTGGTNAWALASNWTPAVIPGSGQHASVIIPSGGTQPTLSTALTYSLDNLTIQSGATLTITGSNPTITNLNIQPTGTLTITNNTGQTLTTTNVTIGASGSSTGLLDLKGNTLAISGSILNYGTLQRYASQPTTNRVWLMDTGEGTVIYNGNDGSGGPYYVQDYGSQDYYNLTVNTPVTLNYDLGVNGTLTLGATMIATGKNVSVGGNFSPSTFYSAVGSGTVIFNNASMTTVVTGTTSFYNLQVVLPGKIVNLSGTTSTIANGGKLTVTGASGNLVTLTGSSTWTLDWAAGSSNASVTYAAIDHSTTQYATTANSSVNNLNNNGNWTFTPGAGFYTWLTSPAPTYGAP